MRMMKWPINWHLILMSGCCKGYNWTRIAAGAFFGALRGPLGGGVSTLILGAKHLYFPFFF